MTFKVLALIALIPCLAACGTVFDDRRLVAATPVGGYGQPMGSAKPKDGNPPPADLVTIDLPQLINGYSGNPDLPPPSPAKAVNPENARLERALVAFDTQFKVSAGSKTEIPDAQKQARNSIIYTIMAASDQNCQVFIQYLHGNQVLVRSLSASLSTFFSTAASVTSPIKSANVLSALGTVSSGIGNTIDINAFSKSTVDAIVAGMKADQAEFKTEIVRKTELDYDKWPLAAGLTEAVEYHNKCDPVSALAYLQGRSNQTSKDATAAQTTSLKGGGNDPPPAPAGKKVPAAAIVKAGRKIAGS